MSKYGVLSGPYFAAVGLNTERYEVSLHIQYECGKYGPEKTPYLDTFYAVTSLVKGGNFDRKILDKLYLLMLSLSIFAILRKVKLSVQILMTLDN